VLARLSQIDGVENCFANEPGSLVGLSLRPGADPRKVAREAQHVLNEEAKERGAAPPRAEEAAPLTGHAASAALRAERWLDRDEVARQAAEIAAAEGQAPPRRLLWLLLALVPLFAALWWRTTRRGERRGSSPPCEGRRGKPGGSLCPPL
jgi:hypothetical protein